MNGDSIFHTEPQYSDAKAPDWWRTDVGEVEEYLDDKIVRGTVGTLAASPGGRSVKAVFYGDREPNLRGTANWNSALGAKEPSSYFDKKKRKRPVLVVLAGVHGQEMEGTIGALSLLNILESGCVNAPYTVGNFEFDQVIPCLRTWNNR